jgi:hypothetical protein
MALTIDSSKNTNPTFDQTYNSLLNINGAEYDIVFSYFVSISPSRSIASNFTLYLFRIAAATGVSVISLLENFKGKTSFQVTGDMAYYLNTMKSNATLYGITQLPSPNQPVQRNIVI